MFQGVLPLLEMEPKDKKKVYGITWLVLVSTIMNIAAFQVRSVLLACVTSFPINSPCNPQ